MLTLIFQSPDCLAESTNAPPRTDFEAFRIISQRNIFNPNRSSRPSRNENSESPKSTKSESFTLVGTMLYENGQFAFFDSSSSTYKKVVKPDDSIAGGKIVEVAPNGVKIELNGRTVELAVGQQMKKQDEGEWTVSGKAAVAETTTGSSASGSGSSSASSSDDEATLQRLLKRREEELNK